MFNRTYPDQGRIQFDGGKDNKFPRALIPDNESPDCANVIFTNGSVETRGGTSKFNTTSVGTFACEGLYTRHDNTGFETMVAFFGGSFYYATGTTFVSHASSTSIFVSGTRVAAAEYQNNMFFGNGLATPYKYNGTDFTRHGVPTPASNISAFSTAAGVVTGQVQYCVTYVNSFSVEGECSPVSPTFTVSVGAQILLTDIQIAPASFGVVARRIYRSQSGATYFLVTTLNNNTATTFIDNTDTLGAMAPDDAGVPPNYSIIIYHQNRMFIDDPSNKNYVWYSNLGDPYNYDASNFIPVGDNTGDLVRGFAIFDNALFVFCDKSQWVIYMPDTDPSTWRTIRVRSSYGSKSPFAPVIYNNKVLFAAMQNDKMVGFGAISGDTLAPDTTLLTVSAAGSDLKSERIEPDMYAIVEAYVRNISSMIFQNKAYITVTYDVGATINNRVYVYDFSLSNVAKRQEASWVPWTGLNAAQFTIYNGSLYYACSNLVGFVYVMNTTTYNDSGTAINSYYQTKEFSGLGGEENYVKDFRFANLLYGLVGQYFMEIKYRVDSDRGAGESELIDVTEGGSLWGTMVWGTDPWSAGFQEAEKKIFLNRVRGKRIQFQFNNRNIVNQKFKSIGLSFTYNLKGKR